jgi:hypothetical protein
MELSLLHIIVAAFVLYLLFSKRENFGGTSPATLIQLAASSGYYPFWRYGYGYRWPYYRYIYPYYANHPSYTSYYKRGMYPRPYGWYQAFNEY